MKPQIVNIINFIRGIEPRDPRLDLHKPVAEQARLSRQYQLPTTFLLQYDALLDSAYAELLKEEPLFQLGLWLEFVQPQVEACGLPWRGRYPWDWRVDAGFSVGYTQEERKRLIDEQARLFREIFGYLPKTAGAWYFDAFTAEYLWKKYGMEALCNCKDQWGTDGYTMWGGYYNQAYYPSIYNSFTPAQSPEKQLDIPIFRMLGSDPIRQYDFGLTVDGPAKAQGVASLEPVYGSYGANPDWVDWYLRENFNGKCLSFGYTQVGQENSFGWEAMGDGYTMQMKRINRLRAEGKLSVLTLEEAGKWYRQTYAQTPPASIVAADEDAGLTSVWYCCRRYRMNLYADNEVFRVRDFQLFNEDYREMYLDSACTDGVLIADNLPVVDGNIWSGNGVLAGIYPVSHGKVLSCTGPIQTLEPSGGTMEAAVPVDGGKLLFTLNEDAVEIAFTGLGETALALCWNAAFPGITIIPEENGLRFCHRGAGYFLKTEGAKPEHSQEGRVLLRGETMRLIPQGLL